MNLFRKCLFFIYPEDRGRDFLRSVDIYIPDHMASRIPRHLPVGF